MANKNGNFVLYNPANTGYFVSDASRSGSPYCFVASACYAKHFATLKQAEYRQVRMNNKGFRLVIKLSK